MANLLNSLSAGKYGCDFKSVNMKHNSWVHFFITQVSISLEWMPDDSRWW